MASEAVSTTIDHSSIRGFVWDYVWRNTGIRTVRRGANQTRARETQT